MALAASVGRRPHFLPHLFRYLSSTSSFPNGSGHAYEPEIRRLAKHRRFADIESLIELRKQDLPADPSSREPYLASFIIAYTSAGMIDKALQTLDDIPRLGSPLTLLSLNSLLSSCNHTKSLSARVPNLFSDIARRYSLSPDKVTYGILIKSLCLSRDASKALLVFKEMEEKGIEITAVSYTTIIDSLYKEGKPEEAEQLWKEMGSKIETLDVPAYNVRVMHSSAIGKLDEVLGLMEEMKDKGLRPDIFTYNYLMKCYCTHGRIDDAKRVYKELQELGCEPNASTYKSLLHALCKHNDFVGGAEVFDDALKKMRVPDLGSVMMLVKGLMKGAKVRSAKRVVARLRKNFPEDFASGWKKLEELVGLDIDEDVLEVEG